MGGSNFFHTSLPPLLSTRRHKFVFLSIQQQQIFQNGRSKLRKGKCSCSTYPTIRTAHIGNIFDARSEINHVEIESS